MKICDYDKCGIHSRLKNIISKSGGYDRYLSSKILMKEYNFDDADIAYEMAKDKKIRESIKLIGIDNVIDSSRSSIILRRTKFSQCMSLLKRFDIQK